MNRIFKVERRDFLKISAAAGTGLVLGSALPIGASDKDKTAVLNPSVYLFIDTKGTVTIVVSRTEMGQGVRTAWPMVIAEELECAWEQIRVEPAIAAKKYGSMGTGGSSSIRRFWTTLRETGAVARTMLIRAAASAWKADESDCRALNGEVEHRPTGRKMAFGDLVEAAAKLPIPEEIPLKDPKEFKIIGKPVHRLDTPEKVDGSAIFGLDTRVPGMFQAVVARPPTFEAGLKSFNSDKALKVPGVKKVFEIDSGVAVVADSTWAALKGREALKTTWEKGPHDGLNSEGIDKMLREKAAEKAAVARKDGDPEGALKGSAKVLEAEYQAPFLSHAPMEPQNAIAHVRENECEVWVPSQSPQWVQGAGAKLLDIPEEKMIVHTTLAGGAFGARHLPNSSLEAIQISKGMGAPVQVVWTREEDMRYWHMRPISYHKLSGGLDSENRLTTLTHRMASPSISEQLWPGSIKEGLDSDALSTVIDTEYKVPNYLVDFIMANTAVPILWWRSVYASQNPFSQECFLDELAHAAGRDPLELRLSILDDKSRLRGVLALATKKSGWGDTLPKGRGRGIAAAHCFGGWAAEVAEVSVGDDGAVKVHRVVIALDCGIYVNPDTIEAQMEGCVALALGAALKHEITVKDGHIVQGNFDDYPLLTMEEMPEVEVHLVRNNEDPGGVGEPGLPPLAPAVGNAIFDACGVRVRRMPIGKVDLTKA